MQRRQLVLGYRPEHQLQVRQQSVRSRVGPRAPGTPGFGPASSSASPPAVAAPEGRTGTGLELAFSRPDAKRTICTGPGVTPGPHLRVGERQEFRVHLFRAEDGEPCFPMLPGLRVAVELKPRDDQSGPASAKLASPSSKKVGKYGVDPSSHLQANSHLLQPEARDCDDGTFHVEYTVTQPGFYVMVLTVDGLPAPPPVPQLEFLPGAACGTTCEVSGLGAAQFVYEELNHFSIVARDEFGNACVAGGDRFGVRASGHFVVEGVRDEGDGTYTVSYSVRTEQRVNPLPCCVEILLLGSQIRASPVRPREHAKYHLGGSPAVFDPGAAREAARALYMPGTTSSLLQSQQQPARAPLEKLVQQVQALPAVPQLDSFFQHHQLHRGAGGIKNSNHSLAAATAGAGDAELLARTEEWARLTDARNKLDEYRQSLIAHQTQLLQLAAGVKEECAAAERQHLHLEQQRKDNETMQAHLELVRADLAQTAEDRRKEQHVLQQEHVVREKEAFVDGKIRQLEKLEKRLLDREADMLEWRGGATATTMDESRGGKSGGAAWRRSGSPEDLGPSSRFERDFEKKRALLQQKRELRYAREMLAHQRAVGVEQQAAMIGGASSSTSTLPKQESFASAARTSRSPDDEEERRSRIRRDFDMNKDRDFLSDILGISSPSKGASARSRDTTTLKDQLLSRRGLQRGGRADLGGGKYFDPAQLEKVATTEAEGAPRREGTSENKKSATSSSGSASADGLAQMGRCMRRMFKRFATGSAIEDAHSVLPEALTKADFLEVARVAKIGLAEETLDDLFEDVVSSAADADPRPSKSGATVHFELFADLVTALARKKFAGLRDHDAVAALFTKYLLPLG
mmetsp:Transcript_22208/g.55993  ORF Transcript_22208/g.55993 Transcript_22208/m.55993 type:complete len:858 (+) Transcript_22208:224-2797(+)|eukprot:CAMPEP_0178986342 /NCGR_PEP_ID=MMETSP0795-20121207/2654_1 /TAXON_ID=88552 /ORGANISM="Amoebophrya sp., Strain Ameob2" /LENGTH=857 /DNA_ID=CAMNT_0020677399 /DNA_START=140 /DNA_END=2713 /DNA_ORIENTATION=+